MEEENCSVYKWGVFEVSYKGLTCGNPFTDYNIYGEFKNQKETKTLSGFYDGDGIYKIRFMPSFEGKYTYKIYGNFSEKEYEGEFYSEAPDSHGMVKADGHHFNIVTQRLIIQ